MAFGTYSKTCIRHEQSSCNDESCLTIEFRKRPRKLVGSVCNLLDLPTLYPKLLRGCPRRVLLQIDLAPFLKDERQQRPSMRIYATRKGSHQRFNLFVCKRHLMTAVIVGQMARRRECQKWIQE